MKKAIVIGCPGAGKSTFARKLRDATGLPLFYLDMIWHRPDRTNITEEEFDAALADILRSDRWIIDGNYGRTLDARLERCDAVFFLDYPTELCLASAAGRVGAPREDMPWTEEEFDPEFRRWILDFPKDQLPHIRRSLEKHPHLDIHIFHDRAEADDYLTALQKAVTTV